MRIRRIDERERTHARPAARVLRQYRRVRMRFVEILHDGHRLEQDRPIAVDQRRQQHLRIDLLVSLLPLIAFHQVDVDHLVRHDALDVERDAHAK